MKNTKDIALIALCEFSNAEENTTAELFAYMAYEKILRGEY